MGRSSNPPHLQKDTTKTARLLLEEASPLLHSCKMLSSNWKPVNQRYGDDPELNKTARAAQDKEHQASRARAPERQVAKSQLLV